MYGTQLIQVLDNNAVRLPQHIDAVTLPHVLKEAFMIPSVDIKAEHSCNWKCCMWCCPKKHDPVTPPPSVDSQDSSVRVETTTKVTQVYVHHKGKG